jgi:adenylate cyclase
MKLTPSGHITLWRTLIGTAITALVAGLMLWQFPPLEQLEAKLLDARFKLRGVQAPPDAVAIAAIDEKSLQKLGRWPWRRQLLARLVDRLGNAEAAVIAFDVLLSEPDPDDKLLAAAMERAGNVILPVAFSFSPTTTGSTHSDITRAAYASVSNRHRFAEFAPITAETLLTPAPELTTSAMELGHITMLPDRDGTMRWEALAIGYGDQFFPPLGIPAAAAFLGIPGQRLKVDATKSVEIGRIAIPTDGWGRTVINYYGPGGSFPTYSICDILDGSVAAEQLQNRIVLIGATAAGAYDLRVTPFSAAMPGVEKHASIIASILDRSFIRQPPHWQELTLLIVSGLILTLVLNRLRLIGAAATTGLMLAALFLASYLLFAKSGIWINLAYPANNLLFVFIGITAFNYAVEERRARKIRAMFASYVTQSLVNELIENPQLARLGGERREVTILFSDIRNFTGFAEQHSPEEVVAILNEYLGAMTDVILKWKGTLDKFIGDAIVAFWGAPLPNEEHAEVAIRCALEMQVALAGLRQKWETEGKTPLSSGIGINTGEVLVGNIGAEGKKMDYTVIGDQVNLCSRVEALTRRYDVPILVTGNTVQRLAPRIAAGTVSGFSLRGLEQVIVKGKEEPVPIYALEELADRTAPASASPCPSDKVVRLTEK